MMRVSRFMTTPDTQERRPRLKPASAEVATPVPCFPRDRVQKTSASIQHVPKRQLVLQDQFLG